MSFPGTFVRRFHEVAEGDRSQSLCCRRTVKLKSIQKVTIQARVFAVVKERNTCIV